MTKVQLNLPKNFKKTGQFKVSEPDFGLNAFEMWWSKLKKSVLGQNCVIFGAPAVEAHHVRKIRE